MLVRVFTHLANAGNPHVVNFIQNLLVDEGDTATRIQIINDQAILETKTKKTLKVTNGLLFKKLQKERPKFTIPTLVELCRVYDYGIELDQLLTSYLNKLLGTGEVFLPFSLSTGKLTTSLPKKLVPKSLPKSCKRVQENKTETTIQLSSNKRLRATLVGILRRQAL